MPCSIWLNELERLDLPEGALRDGVEVVVAGGPDYYPGGGQASPSFSFRATCEAGGGGRPDGAAGGTARHRGRGLFELQAKPTGCGVADDRRRHGGNWAARRDLLAGLERRASGTVIWASRRFRTAGRRRGSRRDPGPGGAP